MRIFNRRARQKSLAADPRRKRHSPPQNIQFHWTLHDSSIFDVIADHFFITANHANASDTKKFCNLQLIEFTQKSSKKYDLGIDIRVGNVLSSIMNMEVNQMQAYCVKCRAKREMKDARAITMKNGKPATQGLCPTCGTKMFRIGKG